MILCNSLPFQTISVIQGNSFSTLYRPINGRLNYAKQFGDCRKIEKREKHNFMTVPILFSFSFLLDPQCRLQGVNGAL